MNAKERGRREEKMDKPKRMKSEQKKGGKRKNEENINGDQVRIQRETEEIGTSMHQSNRK